MFYHNSFQSTLRCESVTYFIINTTTDLSPLKCYTNNASMDLNYPFQPLQHPQSSLQVYFLSTDLNYDHLCKDSWAGRSIVSWSVNQPLSLL